MDRYILEPRESTGSHALYAIVDCMYKRPEERVLCVLKLRAAKRIMTALNFEEGKGNCDAVVASLKEMIDAYGSDDGGGPITIIERARAALLNQEGK